MVRKKGYIPPTYGVGPLPDDSSREKGQIPPTYGVGPSLEKQALLHPPCTALAHEEKLDRNNVSKSTATTPSRLDQLDWSLGEKCAVVFALTLWLATLLGAIIAFGVSSDAATQRDRDGTTGTGFLCEPRGMRYFVASVVCLGMGFVAAVAVWSFFARACIKRNNRGHNSPWAIVAGVLGACCFVGLAIAWGVHFTYCL